MTCILTFTTCFFLKFLISARRGLDCTGRRNLFSLDSLVRLTIAASTFAPDGRVILGDDFMLPRPSLPPVLPSAGLPDCKTPLPDVTWSYSLSRDCLAAFALFWLPATCPGTFDDFLRAWDWFFMPSTNKQKKKTVQQANPGKNGILNAQPSSLNKWLKPTTSWT